MFCTDTVGIIATFLAKIAFGVSEKRFRMKKTLNTFIQEGEGGEGEDRFNKFHKEVYWMFVVPMACYFEMFLGRNYVMATAQSILTMNLISYDKEVKERLQHGIWSWDGIKARLDQSLILTKDILRPMNLGTPLDTVKTLSLLLDGYSELLDGAGAEGSRYAMKRLPGARVMFFRREADSVDSVGDPFWNGRIVSVLQLETLHRRDPYISINQDHETDTSTDDSE